VGDLFGRELRNEHVRDILEQELYRRAVADLD
jgi:hypothetical protein